MARMTRHEALERLLDEMRQPPVDLPPEPEDELLARIARLDGLLGRLIETLERDP